MKEVKAKQIEITTDRLIIRTPDERDIHDIFVLMSDLEIAASTGFRPMSTLSEAEGKSAERWTAGGCSVFPKRTILNGISAF